MPYLRGDLVPGGRLRTGMARLTTLPGAFDTGSNLVGIGVGCYNYYTAYCYFKNG